ncbi:MAG: phytanoyl-CoA hydroxylase [Bradyrhizobium sp.]|jgi:ectoine hydroxylase-related dioxygenase (phytanoyl-CoA dioxygenase family)|nr:phytanoyl-CoA hydroxylase [Bradyrhizobium sp.]
MVDLKDLSVDAHQNTDHAKLVFEREGILVVKNLLPAHVVQTVADFLRDALKEIDEALRQYGFSMEDTDAVARLTALMEESPAELTERHRHMFLGHFPLKVRLAEPLREIPRFLNSHPLLFDLLSTRRLYAHMPPTARYVLPHCSLARVPLHQDISYNRHMGDFCVVWVPLVPIDLACGGMVAYARTHNAHEMVVERRQVAADGWLPPINTGSADDGKRVVLAPLDAGDVVVMGKRTMHESMPNSSDRMRLSCDFRFFGEQSHSTKHYLDIAANAVVAPVPEQ